MSKKNGFTLVELMVVIVIIGVLAAVAIPKMMAATNKAKAGEGPQLLRSIASMEAAYKAENDTYISADAAEKGPAEGAWKGLGFDQNPFSRYFTFSVTGGATYKPDGDYAVSEYKNEFLATAALSAGLGDAVAGTDNLTINEKDERVGTDNIKKLVPNWK
ncbi:MAG: type II secretion system GspH family protein [Chitinivibrionia bacterium]|nr:type II secretion system GspH family protein [Chitinivibrionia bacterium]MCL1946352.1 type II secretion system GspH family protein [Chitinivibrionia bacterium]